MTFYNITTTYVCEDGSKGVRFSHARADCTANAMRIARDEIAERVGAIEVTSQHARASGWDKSLRGKRS